MTDPIIEEPLVIPRKARAPRHMFVDDQNRQLTFGKEYKKVWRDALRHHLGDQQGEKSLYTVLDVSNPTGGVPLVPSAGSPICQGCGLHEYGCKNPFIKFSGSTRPLVTFVFDSISGREDNDNSVGGEGHNGLLKKFVATAVGESGVAMKDIRWATLTRCANRTFKSVNFKTKGNHCRIFFLQDLMQHMPKLIIPVGTVALGLLCHKSNAQDWGGRVLTWRGWPDDWLTDPVFMKPRQVMAGDEVINVLGHPIFGAPPGPEARRLLYPVQAPKIVHSFQNPTLTLRWKKQIVKGLRLAHEDVTPNTYDFPHYSIITDSEEAIRALNRIVRINITLKERDKPGVLMAYDTETEGLLPFHGQKIVFMMFRYTDPETDEPVAFGFPWDYAESERGPASPMLPHLSKLQLYVEAALVSSTLVGHNTTFDALFTFKQFSKPGDHVPLDSDGNFRADWIEAQVRLNSIANAFKYDTWHMAYTRKQERGSLGLEVVTYDFAPELAGYEEDFTLLIELERELLHPANGGHYARCPLDKWDSHLKPYVLGDVEACYRIREGLQLKLLKSKTYKFPIANTKFRNRFQYFEPPDRNWLYHNIMAPASSLLTKIMGRGMTIDEKALSELERYMPMAIHSEIEKMKKVGDGIVTDYIQEMQRTDEHKDDPEKCWEFDLESKDQLREVLFRRLKLSVQRLTKSGRKMYGEEPEQWESNIRDTIRMNDPSMGEQGITDAVAEEMIRWAALDKFTLNKLAVDYDQVRPLQDYRKIHKLYTTYVRPLRNIKTEGLDKKARIATQHLCPDGCIHAQFMLTGTRGGRLSCRNPNLQQLPKEGVKYESVDLQIKKMYVSRFGTKHGCLYGADFSQIELRLLAACSGDETMVKAYDDGTDLHTLTTSKIFNMPYDEFSKDNMKRLEASNRSKEAKELRLKRDIGKTVNFLTGYGGGGFGLQTVLAGRQVYRDLDWCESLVKAFFKSYPAVRDMLSYYKRFIRDNEVAVSMFGRVRVFEEVNSGDKEAVSKALRAGCNHLIQSTASDMMLVCLFMIEYWMRQLDLKSVLVSTVHDSLVIDAVRDELPEVHKIVNAVLNDMPSTFKDAFGPDYDTSWMIVPFAGDCEVGHNYGDMRAIPGVNSPDWDRLLDDTK